MLLNGPAGSLAQPLRPSRIGLKPCELFPDGFRVIRIAPKPILARRDPFRSADVLTHNNRQFGRPGFGDNQAD